MERVTFLKPFGAPQAPPERGWRASEIWSAARRAHDGAACQVSEVSAQRRIGKEGTFSNENTIQSANCNFRVRIKNCKPQKHSK